MEGGKSLCKGCLLSILSFSRSEGEARVLFRLRGIKCRSFFPSHSPSVRTFCRLFFFKQIMEEIHSMTSKDKLSPVPVLGFSAVIERAEVGAQCCCS